MSPAGPCQTKSGGYSSSMRAGFFWFTISEARSARGLFSSDIVSPFVSLLGFASDGDEDFSFSVSSFQIPHGFGDLGERVGTVDDRCDLPGFDELLEDQHVLVVLLVDERAQLLTHQRGQHHRPELAICAPEPPSSPFASNDDEGPPGGEGPPEA